MFYVVFLNKRCTAHKNYFESLCLINLFLQIDFLIFFV